MIGDAGPLSLSRVRGRAGVGVYAIAHALAICWLNALLHLNIESDHSLYSFNNG